MTNREAKGILVNLEADYRDLDPLALTDDGIRIVNERIEAVGVAISALEKQDVPDTNVGDTISRQAVFDIINAYAEPIQGYIGTPNDSEVYAYARGLLLSIERNIRALPSAQSEIIRCKDCKYYKLFKYDGVFACHYVIGAIVQRYSDDFCSRAERRNDED